VLAADPRSLHVSCVCRCLARLGFEEFLCGAIAPTIALGASVYSAVMPNARTGLGAAAVLSTSLLVALPA
jgi:hypothetical protein